MSDGGTGLHTMTFTNRTHTVMGRVGGEDSHFVGIGEMPGHTHNNAYAVTDSGSTRFNTTGGGGQYFTANTPTDSKGGDEAHNNMQPFAVTNYIIKT